MQDSLRVSIAPVCTNDEAAQPLGFGAIEPEYSAINFDTLVNWRLQHQSRHAALGVRTRGGVQIENQKAVSIRRQIIREFHVVLKESQEQGESTGVNRNNRWRAPAPGGRGGKINGVEAPTLENGNSANAAVAAGVATSAVRTPKC